MTSDTATEDRERSSAILITALLLSLIAHAALMVSLRQCSFNTFADAARSSRKWTRDLPTMHVVRHTGDPLAAENVRGRPAAAPVVESVQERVARLAESPAEKAPALPNAIANKVDAPPPPEPQAAVWKPQEQLDVLDHPVASDDEAIRPQVVSETAAPLAGADILPPADLPVLASPVASVSGGSSTGTGSASGIGSGSSTGTGGASSSASDTVPPPPPPPVIGFGTGADGNDTFGFASSALAAAAKVAAEAPPAEKPPPPKPPPTPKEIPQPVLPKVDEKVVVQEKKAVKELRDERPAEPFAQHVRCDLGHWTDPQHPDFKYFRVRISSNPKHPLEVISKDVIYLLDASGSIANDRLKSCRRAISDAIRTLNSNDRFNVVAFRDKFTYLFNSWREVDAASVERADKWLHNLTAHGRTDVFKTLRSVLAVPRSPDRPLIALVVTDGEPTSGMTQSAEIISAFSELNDGLISVYMYGVKEEANSYLMDMLTRGNRGEWTRHTGMRWHAASGIPELAARFRDPVLTDVSVTFAAASRVDAYPKRVTHLYAGGPIDIYGVCPASNKEVVFAVRGLNGTQAHEDVFRLTFDPSKTLDASVKTAWAQRRLYALAGEYASHPSEGLLRDLKLFSRHFGVAIPYESELGKTSDKK